MNTTAATTRYLRTLWTGAEPWQWLALYVGHVQPRGYRTFWRGRFFWQWHVTPLHFSRDSTGWTAGLCFGRRTLLIYRHR